MKLVLAFVQPFKLNEITRGLEEIGGFPGMSVGAVRGFGRDHLETRALGDELELEDFTDKIQIEAIVQDDQVDVVINAIAAAAHTGRYGDGMIFILPVERSFRIATLREGLKVV